MWGGWMQAQDVKGRARCSLAVASSDGRGDRGSCVSRKRVVNPGIMLKIAKDLLSIPPNPPANAYLISSSLFPPHLQRGVVVDKRRCAQDRRQSDGYRHLGLLQLLPGLPRLQGVGEVWGVRGARLSLLQLLLSLCPL